MKLKIMLINPPRVAGFPVVREERFEHKDIGSVYPPLSLLYMAAVLEKNASFEVKVLDANGYNTDIKWVKEAIAAFAPDLVISRCGFDTQKEDFEVLRAAGEAGAVTALRSRIIADVNWIRDGILIDRTADVFINSEPEAVVEGLAAEILRHKEGLKPGEALKDNMGFLVNVKGISFFGREKVMTTFPAAEIANIDSLPYPAYHLLPDLKPYHTGVMEPPFALVQTTRGCPFQCTFCAFGRTKCRERSVGSVINELKYFREKFGIKSFLFFDDTLSIKQGRVVELCERMMEEGLDKLKWTACTRANLVSREMLAVMKKAGMKEIAIGIESGSAAVLEKTKKGVTLEDIRRAAKWCHELGIMFYGLAIIGLPGETEKSVEETIEFIKEIDPFYTQFCFSTPFPNTDMYGYYEEKGLLLTKDWEKYFPLSDEPVIRTEELTAGQLKELRAKAYSKILMRPGYLLRQIRPFDWKWNIAGLVKISGRIIRVVTGRPVR
jgi:radical SAM superfamily enzyme YgiQ (UPF0313 family)